MGKNGGARPGAGRPRKEPVLIRKIMAEQILAGIDERAAWEDLLSATTVTSVALIGGEDGSRENITQPDYRIRIDALKYLTNRRDGMPAQSVTMDDKRSKILLRSPQKGIPCQTDAIQ